MTTARITHAAPASRVRPIRQPILTPAGKPRGGPIRLHHRRWPCEGDVVEVTVTHTLSAHFVEVAAPSTMQFDHGGVSVRVAAAINPDAAFATITCAGMSNMADDAQLSDATGTIGVLSNALIMLPDPHDQHYAPAV